MSAPDGHAESVGANPHGHDRTPGMLFPGGEHALIIGYRKHQKRTRQEQSRSWMRAGSDVSQI